MAKLKEPARFIWDDRLSPEDKGAVDDINRIVSRLSDSRAIEINIAGPFLRSKMAWKLAVYSQGLQHRIVHLADAVAICWNNKSALGTFLAGRAIIETVATISLLKDRTVTHLATKDLAALNGILDSSTFATRRVLVIEYPEIAAQNVMTVIGKLAGSFRVYWLTLSGCQSDAILMPLATRGCFLDATRSPTRRLT
ncbi:hypothetical protein [Neorhizobium sp. T6_25]|uniref:hypothetical protein n=1 Tax=Neorhizobium sp. T6_25 TaxID=2093833 RepID=UPI000CF99CD3|nr:hypothetical protein [Neorhizobium sp. T6_25]